MFRKTMMVFSMVCMGFIASNGDAREASSLAKWQVGGAFNYHRPSSVVLNNASLLLSGKKLSFVGGLGRVRRNMGRFSLEAELGYARETINYAGVEIKTSYVNIDPHVLFNFDPYEKGVFYIGGGAGPYFEKGVVNWGGMELGRSTDTIFAGDILAGLEHYFNDRVSVDARGKYIIGNADVQGWAINAGLNYSF